MGKIRKLLNEVKSFMGNSKAAKPTKKVQKTAAAKVSAPDKKKAAPAPAKLAKAAKAQKGAKAANPAKVAANGKSAPLAAPAAAKGAKAAKGSLGAPVSNQALKSAPALPAAALRVTGAKGKKASGLSRSGKGEMPTGEAVCREVACEGLSTTHGYCRLHYIKNWKKIKRKELILKEKKLNQYIEELVAKYPDKYIEAIRQDLANDKDFAKVIHDLDLDESIDDFDGEGDVDNLIDTIKRDFEDEGEAF